MNRSHTTTLRLLVTAALLCLAACLAEDEADPSADEIAFDSEPLAGCYTDLDQKHAALGGEAGPLGRLLLRERTTDVGWSGWRYHYERGEIVKADHIGCAYAMYGGIYQAWRWHRLLVGVPITDEEWAPDLYGRFNLFDGGAIYWSPGTGAHAMPTRIHDKWQSLGGVWSGLGYPVLPYVGTYTYGAQTFEWGAIYDLPSDLPNGKKGVYAVYGGIGTLYRQMGGENSVAGFPITDEYNCGTWVPSSARCQLFFRGYIHWTAKTGARYYP